jgi:hypothetical protein
MLATAVGVVAGVSLLVVIMGITFRGYSILTKTALPSLQRQTRLTQAPPIAPEPGLPSSVPTPPREQPGNLKQFPAPGAAVASSQQPANLGATPRVPSPATAAPSAASGKSHIAMRAIQGSWIDACADGQIVFRRYLPQRSSVDFEFSNDADVRLGNAGGVKASVNGIPTVSLGALGQVRVVQFDAKGIHFLTPGDPGTECGK